MKDYTLAPGQPIPHETVANNYNKEWRQESRKVRVVVDIKCELCNKVIVENAEYDDPWEAQYDQLNSICEPCWQSHPHLW